MKPRFITLLLCSLVCLDVSAQQLWLYDNTNYKAIYFKDACNLIARTPDLVLLDVRSPGEFADTTQFPGARIGRLKGAINMSVDSVQRHYTDLLAFKNRPILVYCSHSFRSRRVSKFLADSGFTGVYSLNGGMSEVNRESEAVFPCKSSLYTSSLPYKLMGPADANAFVRNKDNLVIDVRPPAQFNGTDSMAANDIGRIKGAINLPLANFAQSIAGLEKYKNKPILVYDLTVSDAVTAATRLKAAGFNNVAVLYDGLDVFLGSFPSSSNLRKVWIEAAPPYHIVGVRETIDLVNNSKGLVVADMRPKDQFDNNAKQKYLDLGHIRNAINFTAASQLEDYLKDKARNTPILIYGAMVGGTMQMGYEPAVDPASLCKMLAVKGYSNIHFLLAGLSSVVWASANVDGQQDAKGILVDHAGLY